MACQRRLLNCIQHQNRYPQKLLFAICIKQDTSEVMCMSTDERFSMPPKRAHNLLGHMSNDTMHKIATNLGWTISCTLFAPCVYCTVAKLCQKNMPKVSKHLRSTKPGECIYLDLCSIKQEGSKSTHQY